MLPRKGDGLFPPVLLDPLPVARHGLGAQRSSPEQLLYCIARPENGKVLPAGRERPEIEMKPAPLAQRALDERRDQEREPSADPLRFEGLEGDGVAGREHGCALGDCGEEGAGGDAGGRGGRDDDAKGRRRRRGRRGRRGGGSVV